MKTPTRALLAAGALVFAVSVPAQEKVTLSIATGPTTGVYYPLGGGIANVLSKYVPGYAANAESTAGSVANLQLMSQKNQTSRCRWRTPRGMATRGRASLRRARCRYAR